MATRTLAHDIAADLRKDIDRGLFAPGEPLRQDDIARRLSVSRIPVREALRLLEQEGLVVVHSNRGAFVVEHDESTISELFDVRLLLESDLLRRACGRIAAPVFERLRRLNADASTTREPHEWLELDEGFHFAIYAAAERPRTFEMARTLRRSLNTYYLRYLTPADRDRSWYQEHDALLECLRRNDAAGAVAELESHLRATQELLVAALRETAARKGE